jgi:hypothetical protein
MRFQLGRHTTNYPAWDDNTERKPARLRNKLLPRTPGALATFSLSSTFLQRACNIALGREGQNWGMAHRQLLQRATG